MIRAALFALALLAVAGFAPAAPEDEPIVFHSDVSLVRVDVQVLDRDKRAVSGLHAEDFILLEEGQPQPIRNFSREEMPVDVLFLLDVSGSMQPHIERLVSASHDALRVLGDNDRVAVMVFDRSTRIRMPFRSNRADIERQLRSVLNQESFDGGTDITRALFDAARYIGREGRRDARRAIVILTDDQTERGGDENGVSRALASADTVLSALLAPPMSMSRRQGGYGGGGGGQGPYGRGGGRGYPGAGYPGGGGGMGGPLGGIIFGRRGPYGMPGSGGGPVILGGPRMQSAGTAEIAQRSGGDSMSVDRASALEDTLARIRQRYALHFNLPEGVKPGQERAIEVELADAARRRYPNAEVRFRRVYIGPGGAADPVPSSSDEPPVISRAPAPRTDESAEDEPATRRFPRRPRGVSEPDGSRGQVTPIAEPAAQPETSGGWKRVEEPKPQTENGGWRRLKPGEQP